MFDASLEGEMTVTQAGRSNQSAPGDPDFSTLDEPIKETFVSFSSQRYICQNLKMSWQSLFVTIYCIDCVFSTKF